MVRGAVVQRAAKRDRMNVRFWRGDERKMIEDDLTEEQEQAAVAQRAIVRRRCRPGWIKPDGEFIPCPNWNDHLHTAALVFPDSAQPEGAAVDAGWLKMYRCDETIMFVGKPLTPKQRRTVEDLFHVAADDAEEEAVSSWRYWQRVHRCSA